jgi:hypothetical protein
LLVLPVLLWRLGGSWKKLLPWYLPFLGLFTLAHIYSLQPFAYDNLKLIHYAYFITTIITAGLIVAALKHRSLAWLAIAPLLLTLLIPGTLTVAREFQMRYAFATSTDLALAHWVRTNTAPSAVFITTDQPNHPVPTLAGRAVVMGYRGWLYSNNLNYQPRAQAVTAALQGQLPSALVNSYKASYIAVSTHESPEWVINHQLLETQTHKVYSNADWIVYQLKPLVLK